MDGLTPLAPIENERGVEKFRSVCGAEKFRVGFENLCERKVFGDSERSVFGVERARERKALVDVDGNLLAFNRFTFENVERFVTKFLLVAAFTWLLNAAGFQGLLP